MKIMKGKFIKLVFKHTFYYRAMGQDSDLAALDTQLHPTYLPPQADIWSKNINEFFSSLPDNLQTDLREYFKIGDCDLLNICVENFQFSYLFSLCSLVSRPITSTCVCHVL